MVAEVKRQLPDAYGCIGFLLKFSPDTQCFCKFHSVASIDSVAKLDCDSAKT